jgi:hypothetical protein
MREQILHVLNRLRKANAEMSSCQTGMIERACAELEQILAGLPQDEWTGSVELFHKLADVMVLIADAGFRENGKLNPAVNGPATARPSSSVLNWALQQFSEEEIVAGLREIRETGGLEFKDFVHELERAAAGRCSPGRSICA